MNPIGTSVLSESIPRDELWLVRSAELIFAGPFTKAQLMRQVRERKLGYKDEVGSSDGSWIRLSNESEVFKGLGKDFQDVLHQVSLEARREEETDTHTSPIVTSTVSAVPPSDPPARPPLKLPPRPPIRLSASQPAIHSSSPEESPRLSWFADGQLLKPLGVLLGLAVVGLLYFLLLRVRIF